MSNNGYLGVIDATAFELPLVLFMKSESVIFWALHKLA